VVEVEQRAEEEAEELVVMAVMVTSGLLVTVEPFGKEEAWVACHGLLVAVVVVVVAWDMARSGIAEEET
jgi:hypothetical protein